VESGEKIGGRYLLDRKIGEGGMASVWLAMDQTLDREVAVKFVYARDERFREQLVKSFLREAKLAASVQHRNVVQILDFGMHGEHVPFMVMERLVGETLADRFDRGEWLRLDEVVHLGTRCLQGLAAVHDAGIVHRDLKPGNIFLVKDRQGVFPKLLDFGISKSLERDGSRPSAVTTRDGTVVGTPEYMSPEQARGVRDLDRRTDIYSLGVILYEAIAGKVPFSSENTGDLLVLVMQGQAQDVVQLVPAVGHEISDVIAKAMQRDRDMRYRDAAEMHDALLDTAQRSPGVIERRPMSYPPRMSRRTGSTGARSFPTSEIGVVVGAAQARRRPMLLAGTGAVVVLGGALAFAALRAGSPPAEAKARFIVVQGPGAGRNAPSLVPSTTLAPPTAVPAPEQADEAEPATATGVPTISGKTSVASAAKKRVARAPTSAPETTSAAAGLADAFARQKGGVVKCFEGRTAEAQATSLAVRVSLDSSGAVQDAQVFPESIAGSDLGTCIASAVRSMSFAAQPEAISFRVPLTARRTQ
jgi:serine/threonine-protein kinase